MWQACPECGASVAETQDGVLVRRQCPLRYSGCEHTETSTRYWCREKCRWSLEDWTCACYPCRVHEEGCTVLKRHEAEAKRAGRPV